MFHAKSKCALKCIKRQFAKLNENWEWKLQAFYEFGDNISFIPLVHDKRKDFRISKQLEVLGGNHAELSIQNFFFFLNHALLVDKPICDQSKYTAEHKYKIYWSNKLIQVSNSSTELPATGGR